MGNDSLNFMKIILLQNIDKLGKIGDVKNVADGYAMNFLFTNKLAEPATADEIRKIESDQIKKEKNKENKQKKYKIILSKLRGISIEIRAKASDAGRLFAGLTEDDIASELKSQKKIEIESRCVKLHKRIKEIGEHNVDIDFGNNLNGNIKVKIVMAN